MTLFDEYEANETQEAKLVKQIDRLESGIQALEYEHKHVRDLEEFFVTTQKDISHAELAEILRTVLHLRPIK
ncbi:hypothetical protein D3C83_246650 [compost metagenome]